MMAFVLSLLIASFVGTLIWLVQTGIKPITEKGLSQTWHYYTGLIPVFFLLGGSEFVSRLISFIRSALPAASASPMTQTNAEGSISVLPLEQSAGGATFANSVADHLLQLENEKELFLFAIVAWAAGTLIFIAVNVTKYRAFKRSILRGSQVCNTVQCPVKVIVSSRATTPMLIGMWKPVIVLPNVPLRKNELAMILSHELVHFRRGDLFVKLLSFAANAVHWFNPAAYAINKQIILLCELSCDERVVRKMDTENRRFYGETLLSMLEYGVMQRNVIGTSSLCNPKRDMKRRLIHLMNEKKTKKSMLALSLVAAIALIGSGGAAAYAAGSALPSPQIPTGKQADGRNVYVQLEDGTIFYYDKDGSITELPEKRKSLSPPRLTTAELVDRIRLFMKDNVPIPQDYVDQLPQKDLDTINETYGLKLQSTKHLTAQELIDRIKKGIEENFVPQAYVNAVPQKDLDAINKIYGWELQKTE